MTQNPWADPSTQTEPGAPYAGPPPTGQLYPGAPYPGGSYPGGYGPAGGSPYGWPAAGGYPWPYAWGGPGYPGWPMPPQGPRRPGQVVAAAVLAFVQAALVLLASFYVFMLATVADVASSQSLRVPGEVGRLAGEARVLAFVQLASVVLLVVAGILALGRPRRPGWILLLAAFGVQVVLAIYWAVRLSTVFGDLPGAQTSAPVIGFSLAFAAPPLVGLGLVLLGPGRRWFDVREPAQSRPGHG